DAHRGRSPDYKTPRLRPRQQTLNKSVQTVVARDEFSGVRPSSAPSSAAATFAASGAWASPTPVAAARCCARDERTPFGTRRLSTFVSLAGQNLQAPTSRLGRRGSIEQQRVAPRE